MARVTVEDCLDKVPNRFSLVLLVAKRTKQLMKGAELSVPLKGNKLVVSSLREVAAGNVLFHHEPSDLDPMAQIQKDLNK
jgi:DNA-directed RNA polymerase subunit omega